MRHPSAALRAFTLGFVAAACAQAHARPHAGDTWAPTQTLRPGAVMGHAGATLPDDEPVRIAVSLKIRHQAAMDALSAARLSGHAPPALTRAEFMAEYAPTPEQVDAVVAHLRGAGFRDIVVAKNRMLISASGSAAAVAAGFATALQSVEVEGRAAYANVDDARVPAALASVVRAVHGLQTLHGAHTMSRPADPATLARTPTASQGKAGHAPTDFPSIYAADGLKAASRSVLGIIAQGDVGPSIADLNDFAANAGFPVPEVRRVIADQASIDTSRRAEWDIDSQAALAAAGGQLKGITFYIASTLQDAPLIAAYNAAVADDSATTINVSLGECELEAQRSGMQAAADALFQIAVAQGQVFAVASGDSGAYECGGSAPAGAYPAVSPYVIAVGGTSLSTVGQVNRVDETLWSCADTLFCHIFGGSGGGTSQTEPAPDWQRNSGLLDSPSGRVVPDVTFDADPASGILVQLGGATVQYGGTSLSAPLFAGFWARLQSANAHALPFPGLLLYTTGPTARGTTFVHDIIAGSNGGYAAGPGWDDVSGFGSLDIGQLQSVIKISQRGRVTP